MCGYIISKSQSAPIVGVPLSLHTDQSQVPCCQCKYGLVEAVPCWLSRIPSRSHSGFGRLMWRLNFPGRSTAWTLLSLCPKKETSKDSLGDLWIPKLPWCPALGDMTGWWRIVSFRWVVCSHSQRLGVYFQTYHFFFGSYFSARHLRDGVLVANSNIPAFMQADLWYYWFRVGVWYEKNTLSNWS